MNATHSFMGQKVDFTAFTDKIMVFICLYSFFLPLKLQVVAIVAPLLFFAWSSRRHLNKVKPKDIGYAMLSGAIYPLYLLAIPFTQAGYEKQVHTMWESRISLWLLPLSIVVTSKRIRQQLFSQLETFAALAVGVCMLVNFSFLFHIMARTLPAGTVNHVYYRVYFEDVCQIHPTYMSLYLVFAIGILLTQKRQLKTVVRMTLIVLAVMGLLPLLAKSPLVALLIIAIHQLWLRKNNLWRYKWFLGGAIAIVGFVLATVPFATQRIKEMVTMFNGKNSGNAIDNSIVARKLILTIDQQVLHKYWLTGTGPARLLEVLKTHFLFYSIHLGYNTGSYDPHNEFFFEWISFGIIGLLAIITMVSLHAINALNNKNLLYAYLLVLLIITFFTESVLANQRGLLFYCFFTSLFLFLGENDHKTKNFNTTNSFLPLRPR